MKDFARVFGLVRGGAGFAEFSGEVVLVQKDDGEKCQFSHQGSLFECHKRQLSKIDFLYPNIIYVKEPSLKLNDKYSKCVIEDCQIYNCYARCGSHWVKYIIAPEELIVTDEDDEQKAQEIALQAGLIATTKEELYSAIKEEIPEASLGQILNILKRI